MKITLDEERTRRLNEAFAAAKAREGAIRDQELLDAEEADERVRRLVQAQGQLAQAWLCYRGLPTQTIIWAYQAADNSMHAALLAGGGKASRNHQRKIDAFKAAFPEVLKGGLAGRIEEFYKLWQAVRYERSIVSRETAQRSIGVAHETFGLCFRVVASALKLQPARLADRIAACADRLRLPSIATSDLALEEIERNCGSHDEQMERAGLSGVVSQLAHAARDISIDIAADQSWVRGVIEGDEQIAHELANLHKAFHTVVTALVAKRVTEMFQSDPQVVREPERLVSASDFNMACVFSYAGLSTLDTVRCLISVARDG